ncbi:tyrosine-protein phosphatase 99A-like isoform X2 [Acanthaster planci]|uniref:protein-tyrosine-phosphatase n=1 Tax=Acanthaster planci TaxID=133434 RepID=A0A8B7XM02_ACAPL|nr:tyrosine-protein phosphatase 99A-like isoform X2 [Acanthaster planci]
MANVLRSLWGRLILGSGFCLALAVVGTMGLTTTQTVIRGNDISFPCEAYNSIAPLVIGATIMVEWTKDSLPLVESSGPTVSGRVRLDMGTYGLTISVAAISDQGLYACRAEGEPLNPSTSNPLLIQTTQVSLTTTAASFISEESNVTLSVEEPVPPGKPVARVTTKDSIDISWAESNGPVLSYQVLYREGSSTPAPGAAPMRTPISPGLETSLLVPNLMPYTEYSFWVEASYRGGYTKMSEMSVLWTASGTPTDAPQNVAASATSATSIQVSWSAPPISSLNGALVGYRIRLSREGNPVTKTSVGPGTSKEVQGLRPYTNYSVTVAVYNDAMGDVAIGPYSSAVVARTWEAAPSAPSGISTVFQKDTSITIFWEKPEHPNSAVVTFNVDFRRVGTPDWERVKTETLQQFCSRTDLDVYTEYEFRVAAVNSISEGPFVTLTAFTDVAAPGPPVNVTVRDIGMGRVKVSWMEPEVFYRSVDSYTITYLDVGRNVTMKTVEVNKLWRILENLEAGVQYEVKVQAATTNLQSVLKEGQASESVSFTIEKPAGNTTESPNTTAAAPNGTEGTSTPPPGSNLGVIIGVAVGMVYFVATLIVLGSLFFIRARRKDRLEFEKQENGMPPAFAKPDELEEPPIPVGKFEAHVIANHADSDGGFATEYEDIQRVSTNYPALSSIDPNLKYKNRYTNIVAYDHTRVKLSILPNQLLSDYINANYIDGYGRQKAYIAAQGPLKSTVEDFWRMVWEQHTMVIVMITKLEERGRRKCDRYWPAKGMPERYGEFEVTLETKEKYASHMVRHFLLKHKHRKDAQTHGKAPERRILQFHFTDWPDHGVPAYTLPVLAFVQKSSVANPVDAGPMVVHCSAGVGRTGTYIVIDSMLKQMQAENKVNVFGFLKRIRTQRNYLVQTEEQYVFIHDVLLEWLKAGNTTVQAADLRQYTDRMTLPDEQGKVLLDEHFKFIATQKIRDYEFSKARHALNRSKNRSKLLPMERNRVSISGVAGQEGSDYINASFIQGYRRNREFIVTQYPLKETMTEFWRMLWECNSTTIVMLTDKEEDDSPIYWPTNKDESLTFGTIKVTLCEEEHSNMSYITREFLLCCSQDEDQLTVKQYHCSYWPDSCSPLHTAFDLIYALEERSNMLTRVNKDVVGPVTVHDRFGGRQAGTFCALSTLHQQMIMENCVDVYQVVKLYANKRPGMFSSKDEYHFLYRALQSVYTAEQQMKSLKAHSLHRHDSEKNKDWHKMRYMTAVPDSGNLRQMSDSARNSSLDSDNWYRARSQTLGSTGPQRSQRPSKFWHRRTKSEKRKTGAGNANLSIANANALGVAPPGEDDLPGPEVYDLAETVRDGQPEGSLDSENHAGNGTPSTVPDTTVIPEIHLNGLDHLQGDKRHESVHIEDSETIALMGRFSPDTSQENMEMPADFRFAGSGNVKSQSRESLGTHSNKSEETRM